MVTYLVFGRTDYTKPLHQLGVLEAQNAGQAPNDSVERFGSGWVELSLVAETDVVWLLRGAEDAEDAEEPDG